MSSVILNLVMMLMAMFNIQRDFTKHESIFDFAIAHHHYHAYAYIFSTQNIQAFYYPYPESLMLML